MPDKIFIVFNNSPRLHIETPFRDKVKAFREPKKALDQAIAWGFESPFDFGASSSSGVKSIYACGDVNVEILPLDLQDDVPEMDILGLIGLATKVADDAHRNQTRQDGRTPYITHPASVANRVPDRLKPIAWLHDAIENSNGKLVIQDLRNLGFPPYVVDAVDRMTKREGEEYDTYIARVVGNLDSLEVKIADIETNLNDNPSAKARAKYERWLPTLKEMLEKSKTNG